MICIIFSFVDVADIQDLQKIKNHQYFQDQINKIKGGSKYLTLEEHNEKLQVQCHPCSRKGKITYIDPGPREKALSNVKAHIKTSKHVKNVISINEAEKNADAKSNMALQEKEKREAITEAIADVEKKHPGIFELLKSNSQEMVRCMICNTLIIVLPERGSFMINVNKHIAKHTKDKTSLK